MPPRRLDSWTGASRLEEASSRTRTRLPHADQRLAPPPRLVDDFDDGIDVDGTTTGTTFESNILLGGNGQDCEGCTLPGPIRVLTGVNVARSFAGRGGTASRSSIADWTNLPTPYQSWGIDAAYATAASRAQCSSGVCATWDWRLASADPVLHGRSGDGQAPNGSFVVGARCPDAAYGDRVITTARGATYLLNATEIFFDGRGHGHGHGVRYADHKRPGFGHHAVTPRTARKRDE